MISVPAAGSSSRASRPTACISGPTRFKTTCRRLPSRRPIRDRGRGCWCFANGRSSAGLVATAGATSKSCAATSRRSGKHSLRNTPTFTACAISRSRWRRSFTSAAIRCARGKKCPRRFIQVLSSGDPRPLTRGSGRLDLADSILEQPIAARVASIAIWKWHFGTGIVEHAEQFRKARRASDPSRAARISIPVRSSTTVIR